MNTSKYLSRIKREEQPDKTSRRPVVLTFVRHYLPGFRSGGPVRTVSNMVNALGDEIEFRIVTLDRDATDIQPYPGVKQDVWQPVGKAMVKYVHPGSNFLRKWIKELNETDYDFLYLNSLFDKYFTIFPLLAHRMVGKNKGKIILAPRGELSTGALALKAWKKRAFLTFAKMSSFYRGVTWHASSHDEASLIRAHFQPEVIHIAKNLPAMHNYELTDTYGFDEGSPLRIIFLSRITRMKNLDFALQVIKKCNIKIQFDIYGVVRDEEYWEHCRKIISCIPENIRVCYHGELDHSKVYEVLSGYDLFFLPTRGENYGHVIAEALTIGLPVLISDQTPWHGLQENGVGWALPLHQPEAFANAIREAREMLKQDAVGWRKRVREYAREIVMDDGLIEANRRLFLLENKKSEIS